MRSTDIKGAADLMRRGGVVAHPAEACFGLGCDPLNRRAVYKILRLKNRSPSMGLILVADSLPQLRPFLAPKAMEMIREPLGTWPGPVTWLMPASAWAPPWVTGDHDTIAVRMSSMPRLRRLCRAFGGAMISTSANPHGFPPARTIAQVGFYFGNRLDGVLIGMTGGLANPSQIRDAATGAVIRAL